MHTQWWGLARHLDPGLGSFLKGGDKLEGAWVPSAVGSRVSREALLHRPVPGEKRAASVSLRFVWRSPEVLHDPSFSSIFVAAQVPAL